ncbi:MAG: aldo/keto reductase [Deltaproteobacteria bacterium]|nr:aldo/keto reductase [Deltaproteobacteria bacterium]
MLGIGTQHITPEALRAAIAAGIELVDTAHAYGNEALIGEVGAPYIVTKGGLGPDWIPDGRAAALATQARMSRELLGRIDLYLLHAVDRRVQLGTSVRALAKLRDQGIVGAIGVSNVNRAQLDAALAITDLDAIEIELGMHRFDALDLADLCERRNMKLLAYRPFGGAKGVAKLRADPLLRELGDPCEVALAFLRALSPTIIPLPGPTRVETAESCARAAELPAEAVTALRAHFLEGPAAAPRAGEVVLIMGMPGAGKSSLAGRFREHVRLNRDERGGTLAQLATELDRQLSAGHTRVVLDNTYPSRSSRAEVLRIARRHGLPVRGIVLDTPLHDAQRNAIERILARHGRLLDPAELAAEREIGPGAQFRYQRRLEPPQLDEGFASLEHIAFERKPAAPGPRVAIVELDNLIWRGRPRRHPELLPGARERLLALADRGFALAGTAWQPDPFDAAIDLELAHQVGLPIVVARCSHPAGPPVCWCRKPLPGLALQLAHQYEFSLAGSLHIGHTPADRGFAARAGLGFELVT